MHARTCRRGKRGASRRVHCARLTRSCTNGLQSTSQRHGIGHGDLNGQESQDRSLKDPSVSRLNDATEGLARSSAQEPSTAAPGSHDRGGKAAAKDQSTAVPTSNSKPPPSPESKATFYKYFLPFQVRPLAAVLPRSALYSIIFGGKIEDPGYKSPRSSRSEEVPRLGGRN